MVFSAHVWPVYSRGFLACVLLICKTAITNAMNEKYCKFHSANRRECLFRCYTGVLLSRFASVAQVPSITVRSKMSIIKPVIVIPGPEKILCPICSKPTYSRGGIHPQCAMEQADEPRVTLLRNARRADVKRVRPIPQVHKKRCPECDSYSDAQREVCWCGFRFSVGQRVNRQIP